MSSSPMNYRRLGRSGLKISELSFGSWLTFGPRLDMKAASQLMHEAFDRGVNFFDNAEAYADGQSEEIMGKILPEFRREDLVISTKIFWGGKGPNDTGLSFKHLMEGANNALKRMKVEYVDLIFCHRADPDTPMEETVRAMDLIIRQGKAFYWGTSEWSAEEILQAHRIAKELNCFPPVMEQPQYNLFVREKVEREFQPLFEEHGMGTTIWSPLASGMLTGKYQDGIPKGTRLSTMNWLRDRWTETRRAHVEKLMDLANGLGATPAQIAIAWCLKNPNVSTVILGATSSTQLQENLDAARFVDALGRQEMQILGEFSPPE